MARWYRRVFLLAIPLILSNLTQPLLSTVDTVLSGHLPGAAALGGVAVGGIFFNAVFWTCGFLRMSTTGLVAQAHGAGDPEALQLHFLRGLVLALAIGALLVALRGPVIALMLTLLGASAEVRANALIYCHIRMWSAPAGLANYVILGFLLGRQHARLALALQAAVNAVNVAVALWLVIGLHRGVAGIATATLAADWAGFVVGLGLIAWAWPRAAGERVLWRAVLDGPSLRRLFALNRDLLLRTLSLVTAYIWFTRTGARAGDATLAANAVLLNLHWIATYALDGFANATEALVGEALGAGRVNDFRAVLRASTASAGVVAAALSLCYVFAGAPLVGLFTNQAAVRAMALKFLPWAMALPLVSVWAYQMDGVFVGATHARELRDSMVMALAVYLALAIVLERWMGNHGLWCAYCCFMILRGLLLGMRVPRIERDFAAA
jgi:multidrug resistance protein, MATE family